MDSYFQTHFVQKNLYKKIFDSKIFFFLTYFTAITHFVQITVLDPKKVSLTFYCRYRHFVNTITSPVKSESVCLHENNGNF